jgi:hypothetical protein
MSVCKVLGIVGCQVLEDEMAYIVTSDQEVGHILVIDGTEERTLANKIQRLAPDREVSCFDETFDLKAFQLPSSAEMTVVLWLKPISLHQSPPLLREEVMKVVGKLEGIVQSVLIFYGECGSAFRNISLLAEKTRVPITMLKDKDGSPIDDCYGTVLGGREEYRQFLIRQPGPAYILNSMWAANWRHFMQEIQILRDPNDIEEAKEVFKFMDYKTIVGLNTGLVDQAEFERQLDEFAGIFGLQKESRRCSLHVVDSSYQEAKARLLNPS